MKSLLKASLLIYLLAAASCSGEKPTARQKAFLSRLHQNCLLTDSGKRGNLKNLAVLRAKKMYFSCDEMKEECEDDYTSEMCKGMRTIASIENAFQKACRDNGEISARSAACNKVFICNKKAFTSPECASAIAPYNH